MDDRELFHRFAADRVTAALKDTPVVMVNGPRQCGKTILVRDLVAGERAYVTLDDDTVLEGARQDPTEFVRGLDQSTIDEVQRAPDLLRAIKRSVDQDRRPGLSEICTLSHYRDKDQDEVDIVIENETAGLVGIEVKAAATVNAGDCKGLRKLADATGDALRLGIVLYDGENTVPFGDRMFAAPVSRVWG